jgi:regulatory protein
MKIERIIRKDENNVAVFFDNDEKLILSEDVFFKSGLRKGDAVSEDRFSFFVEQNILYHIKQRALSFISRRYHSERELLIKLKSKRYDERLIKIVLSDLKDKNLIDDRIFAIHYIEEKLNRKKWGKNKIKAGLRSKGVDSKIIDDLNAEFDSDKSEFELAYELAEKKIILLRKRKLDEKKIYTRINNFLLTRGFEFDIIKDVCQKLLKHNTN